MTASIVVSGATGNVGSHVARGLLAVGARVRVAVPASSRDAAREAFPDAEAVALEFGDASTYAAAFEGARSMFLMRPPQITDVAGTIAPALEDAKARGVEHVAFLSLQGAESNPIVPHRRVEDWLKANGPAWTMLRPSFFMQNLSTTHRRDILDRDEIFVPAGRGETSFIDVRDIAEVAVKTLLEDGHRNTAYELTGSEALTYREAADILSDVLGREIRYADPSPWAFWSRMRRRGHAAGRVLVMIALYTVCRLGMASRVTDETERLLGRPPRSFREFAADHADVWVRVEEGRARGLQPV